MRAPGGASQRAARNDAQPQVEQHALPADHQAADNLMELRESSGTGSDGSDGRHDEPQPVPQKGVNCMAYIPSMTEIMRQRTAGYNICLF